MEYYNATPPALPAGLAEEIAEHIAALEAKMGKKLGDDNDPLLVSVRSGSPFSMPGMMDTVLNLGLNDTSIQGLIAQTGNERFAWDSYRRFIQMFSKVVLDAEGDLFENAINKMKLDRGVQERHRPDRRGPQAARRRVQGHRRRAHSGRRSTRSSSAPAARSSSRRTSRTQLNLAIEAVFSSWMNERAVYYRKMERIADDLGTAVNVQTMVFGNKGDTSATGVGFTRNPADGTNEYYGDFLTNAQGEDVVAGIRITEPISDLKTVPGLEDAGVELDEVFAKLEAPYRDMCDIEFTIEQGKLWMLQTRIGKRTARAALKIAIDMVDEGMIDAKEAVLRIDPAQLDQLLHPQFDQKREVRRARQGPQRQPGRGGRRGRVLLGRRGGRQGRGPQGHPRALGDQPRRPARHGRRAGHPDVARRQDEPRGRRRPRHGQAVRLRRREAQDRRREQDRARRTTSSCTRATSSRSTAPPASSSSARSRSSSPRSPATSTRSC